jgi:hypothetical protein
LISQQLDYLLTSRDGVWVTVDARERAAPGIAAVVAATAVSWLGFFVHNLADLPTRAMVGPETVGPTAVYLAANVGLGLGGFAGGLIVATGRPATFAVCSGSTRLPTGLADRVFRRLVGFQLRRGGAAVRRLLAALAIGGTP